MASPNTPHGTQTGQPPLVSLVLQSKKALQHGEALCSRARETSNASAQCAVDVLALDAKVKWLSDAVIEQLKLAASVAKSIEFKRAQLDKQARDWDTLRSRRTSALDDILESLGSQVVPPDFHQASTDSSLFGSRPSSRSPSPKPSPQPQYSPSSTIRDLGMTNGKSHSKNVDRSRWKTLRDFADDKAIEEVLDGLDNERNKLDDVLTSTYDYPETLANAVDNIRKALPNTENAALPSVEGLLHAQEERSLSMAQHLESLAAHYDQMTRALHDSEAGEEFSEEDMQDMNRDVEELPKIIQEIEEDIATLHTSYTQLVDMKSSSQGRLDEYQKILDDLDELGEIMAEMLVRQEEVEDETQERLSTLSESLGVVDQLHAHYVQYQISFNKLLEEMARRKRYTEAVDKIVGGMTKQLEEMAEEEHQMRTDFNAEHADHLPIDICLFIENPPTRWEVIPAPNRFREALPDVEPDLLASAKERLSRAEQNPLTAISDSL